MSEINILQEEPEHNTASVLVIGGLLSVKTQWLYYVPILATPGERLSAKERFLPVPDKGLSTFPEMIGQLEEELAEKYEQLEEPVVLVGHSLGARMATELALNNPEKVRAVTCLAGVQDGIKGFTFSGKVLKRLLGNPETSKDLLHDSDMIKEHRKRILTEWPAHISLHLISPTYDDLIPAPQGLELTLPTGQQPERRVVLPRMPRASFGIKQKVEHLQNVEFLRPFLPAGHVDIAICPPVIAYTHQVRREAAAAGFPEPVTVAQTKKSRSTAPVAA